MNKKTKQNMLLFLPATIIIILFDISCICPDPDYIGGWLFAGIITFIFYLAPIAMYYVDKESKNPGPKVIK